jgi:hypothetical protein
MMKSSCALVPALALAAGALSAQTSIDLRTQSRNVDFSAAASTRPSKTGTSIPALCGVGETFFKTDAPPGGNLLLCTAANVWTPISGALSVTGLPENGLPSVTGAGALADSGCTAFAGVATCPNGFTSGTGPSQITMKEGIAPGAAPDGKQIVYLDSADHRLKLIDSTAGSHPLATTAGSLPAGAIAIFDAAGNAVASSCSISAGALSCSLGSGSTLTLSSWYEFPAGQCQAGTAYLGFSVPSANAPAPACLTGANTILGTSVFSAAGQSAQLRFILPDDWVPGAGNDLEFRFQSESAGGTGNVAWNIQTACSSTSVDPAFNSAQTVVTVAQGNNVTTKTTISNFVAAGCAAGNTLFLRFALDASTTAVGNQDLLSLRVRLKRALTTF